MPLPVCKRVRAPRCCTVQGEAFEGYCAAKREYYFGWQLHLVCDIYSAPMAIELLPAHWDELVPIQDLLATLPPGSQVVADKGYISQQDELLAYLHSHPPLSLDAHRRMIKMVNSQLYHMGFQRLHVRTTPGFALKVAASLVALAFTNALA